MTARRKILLSFTVQMGRAGDLSGAMEMIKRLGPGRKAAHALVRIVTREADRY